MTGGCQPEETPSWAMIEKYGKTAAPESHVADTSVIAARNVHCR